MKSLIKNQLAVLPELASVSVDTLQTYFNGVSVTRICALFLYLACILDGRTVNLQKASERGNKLCGKEHKTQKTSSIYGAFKRIFQNGNTEVIIKGLFCLTVLCLYHLTGPLYLVMDRTHWEFRGNVKNVLVIGCVYQGIFIPLIFKDLGRKGNSNCKERKALIEQFLNYWKLTKLPLPNLFLAGDREFIGADWWAFLTLKRIQFSFRIKEGQAFHLWLNNTISDARFKANQLRKALNKPDLTHQEIVLLGEYIFDLFICKNVTPNAKEKFVYIVTNFAIPADAPGFYRQRWAIEVCFKHLKSNGFDLESTGLQGEFKIELLFAITSFVYTLCVVRGICEEIENPPTLKIFTVENIQKNYKQTSTFKAGYTKMIDIVYDLFDFVKVLLTSTNLNISFST
jgi:hypothetical protein